MPRFAANLGHLFTERPLIERSAPLLLRVLPRSSCNFLMTSRRRR